jgi:hypothetical protein
MCVFECALSGKTHSHASPHHQFETKNRKAKRFFLLFFFEEQGEKYSKIVYE